MGFFRKLFGDKSSPSSDRRRWSFTTRSSNPVPSNSSKRRSYHPPPAAAAAVKKENGFDDVKQEISVAKAALDAAYVAEEVVRLSRRNGGRSSRRSNFRWTQEYLAAVKIQSAFRGYLARRALRALKSLVKLQALVRGYIVRKQTSDMLRRMQTLFRLQTQARASRASHSSPSSRSLHTRCVSNAHVNHHGSKRLDWEVQEDDKILEVDTWKPHYESPRKRQEYLLCLRSTENSPQIGSSGSRRRTPFTPTTRSEYSWGCNNYYQPSYMANTESYKAKVRSQSVPKQRLEVSNETRSVKGQSYSYTAVAEQSLDVGSTGYYRGGGFSDRLNRNQSQKSRMHSSFIV